MGTTWVGAAKWGRREFLWHKTSVFSWQLPHNAELLAWRSQGETNFLRPGGDTGEPSSGKRPAGENLSVSLLSSRQVFLLLSSAPSLCPPLTLWPVQYLCVGHRNTQGFLDQRSLFPRATGELISALALLLDPNIAPLLAGWVPSQSSFQYFHPNPQLFEIFQLSQGPGTPDSHTLT